MTGIKNEHKAKDQIYRLSSMLNLYVPSPSGEKLQTVLDYHFLPQGDSPIEEHHLSLLLCLQYYAHGQ